MRVTALHQDLIEVRLMSIRYVARDTNIFEFSRLDGGELPEAEPGSHIAIHLPNGLIRQYSLIIADQKPTSYTVGVKRESASRGGSHYMHDELHVGRVVQIEPPRNNFPLTEDAETTVLFAGGIGITPIHCMVKRLDALQRQWELHYACRSRSDAAFLAELSELGNTHFHFDEEAEGRFLDINAIVETTPRNAQLYCCGPAPMLAAFESATANWPRRQIHVEYFVPRSFTGPNSEFVVELAKSGRTFTIPPDQTILNVLRAGGVDISSSCEEGICGACETRVVSGQPDHRDSLLSDEEREENKTMFVCCSRAKSDKLVLDL